MICTNVYCIIFTVFYSIREYFFKTISQSGYDFSRERFSKKKRTRKRTFSLGESVP